MKIIELISLFVVMAFVPSVVSADVQLQQSAKAAKPKLTEAEKAERKAAAQKRQYERTGGYIVANVQSNRVVAIVNAQGDVQKSEIDDIALAIQQGLLFKCVVADRRPDNAGVVIEVRESNYPAAMLIAPENGYAMVNMTVLKQDAPSAPVLATRVRKEVWRTLIYLLGGGNDVQPMCLMKPIATVEELDALKSTCPCPMSFGSVIETAKRFGVEQERRVTYRRAVMEGWAPEPTNDVQKVIWEEIHAKPTNPMKITFDPKKGE